MHNYPTLPRQKLVVESIFGHLETTFLYRVLQKPNHGESGTSPLCAMQNQHHDGTASKQVTELKTEF